VIRAWTFTNAARAADYALELNRDVLRLDRPGLELLTYAVRHHSDGLLEADITVQTCWDADRLDLGLVCKAVGGEAVHGRGAGSGAARARLSAEPARLTIRAGGLAVAENPIAQCRGWGYGRCIAPRSRFAQFMDELAHEKK
jgi:hypothetical protein